MTKWYWNSGVWQGWLTSPASRHDADEVKRRLEQVPEPMREQVRSHARTVWQLTTNAPAGSKRHRR